MPVHYELGDDHVVWITIDRPERDEQPRHGPLRPAARRLGPLRRGRRRLGGHHHRRGQRLLHGRRPEDLHPPGDQAAEGDRLKRGQIDEIDGYRIDDGVKAVLRGVKLYKPIIAAVNGACVAGGMEMLGGCDLRVAVPEAYFGVMEPKRGLFAGGGTTVRLPRQIPFPPPWSSCCAPTGFRPSRRLAIGLLNAVVPTDELRDKAAASTRSASPPTGRSPCARPRRACCGAWPST